MKHVMWLHDRKTYSIDVESTGWSERGFCCLGFPGYRGWSSSVDLSTPRDIAQYWMGRLHSICMTLCKQFLQ